MCTNKRIESVITNIKYIGIDFFNTNKILAIILGLFLYPLERAGETWPSMTVKRVLWCDWLVDSVWKAACWVSLFTYWVGLGRHTRHLCGVTCGEISLGWSFSWRAYQNSFSPVLSSHCRHCKLIQCVRTLDTWMHQCVAWTRVMTILLLTY